MEMDEKQKDEQLNLEEEALSCLIDICRNVSGSEKSADRISAAKMLLEHSRKNEDWDHTLTVVMEGVKEEYLR